MSIKGDYVKRQIQTRNHICHWPGCNKQVPPAMWGCPKHWFMLPRRIRDMIWVAYVPGQETNMTPTRAYIEAAKEAQRWIKSRVDLTEDRLNEASIPFYDGLFVHLLKRSIDFVLINCFRLLGGPDRNPTCLQRWCRKNEFIGWPWH